MKQVVEKLYSGNVEAYLKLRNQLDHVLKNRPRTKAKLDMAVAMPHGDLLESWKLWSKTESENEVEKTFKSKETDETGKKKVKEGETEEVLWHSLGFVRGSS